MARVLHFLDELRLIVGGIGISDRGTGQRDCLPVALHANRSVSLPSKGGHRLASSDDEQYLVAHPAKKARHLAVHSTSIIVAAIVLATIPLSANSSANRIAPLASWSNWANLPGDYSSGQAVCDARGKFTGWGDPLTFVYDAAYQPNADGQCIDLVPPRTGDVLGWPMDGYFCPDGYIARDYTFVQVHPQQTRFRGSGMYCERTGIDLEKNVGSCPTGGNPNVGNPINSAIGNKFHFETDRTGSTGFIRYYNSIQIGLTDSTPTPHWSTTYDRWIEVLSSASYMTARVRRENGKIIYFSFTGDAWLADADIVVSLHQLTDIEGNTIGWNYVGADNRVERYDETGRLQAITDIDSNTQTLTYDTQNRLARVDSNTGEYLTFAYDAGDRISTLTDHTGRVWHYRYDAAGNLEYVDNPDGTTKRYHYEDARFPHALTGITDERGVRYATYAYDDQGRAILSTHAGNAQRVDIVYNTDGTRTVTNSRGQASTYSTAVQLGVALVTDIAGPGCSTCGNGNTSYNYDPATNNLLSKTENGVTTQYGDYDAKGQYGYKIEAVGTPEQRRTDYTYDPRFYNRITSITEPSVAPGQYKVTTYTYDDWGNRLSATVSGFQPDGTPVSRTTAWQYAGPLHQLSQIDGPRTDVSDVTTYTYYPDDPGQGPNRARLLRVTDAHGVAIRDAVQYTATGKLLSEARPNGLSLSYTYYPGNDRLETLTESAGGVGRVTRWTYLATGEVESITQGYGSAEATTLSFGYDDARRLIRITDGLGNYIAYQLDTEGNREAERIYDHAGTLKKELTQTFDLYNRLDLSTRMNEARDADYAADGALDRETDGRGSVTDYGYDALKRLTQVVQDQAGSDPATANATTGYGYDVAGRLTSVTDPVDGNTTYVYDDLGNLLSQSSPDTGTTTFGYDAAGNLATRTDAKGQVSGYGYDALNRLTLIDGPGTLDFGYGYDSCAQGVGRLCSVTGPMATVGYRYTAFGDVAGIDQTATTWPGLQSAATTLDYGYDAAGRLRTLAYPSGALVTYRYDAAGRVSGVDLDDSGNATALLSGATYHPFGPLLMANFGNGQGLYAWVDQAYRANWRYSGPYQQWINPFSNAYDGNGNLLSFTGSENPVFGYDALDRLTSATAPEFGSRDYAYDRNGNRTQRVADGQTTGYAYQPQSNRLATAGGQPVTLDANGNTTALRGMTLSYDARNRLIGVAGLGEYRYNGLGQRVVKTELVPGAAGQGRRRAFAYGLNGELLAETGPTGQVTREYIYLDGQPLAVLDRVPVSAEPFLRADFDGDGLIAAEDFYEWFFLHYMGAPDPAYDVTGDGLNDQADYDLMIGCAFGGQPCRASQYASRLYYVHNDHLGTPKALTDAAGVKVWSATHDPFGLAAVDEDPDGDGVAVEFDVRFPGQYYDGETGLHYNYFRTYDPGTGRYLESDPIGLLGGLNTYVYANDSPTGAIDRYGLDTTGDSPNPNRPRPRLPGIDDVICAGVNGVCDEQERQKRLENERHQRNQDLIDRGCSADRDNCRYSHNVTDCIDGVRQRCAPQEKEEFERHIRALRGIEESYPVNPRGIKGSGSRGQST